MGYLDNTSITVDAILTRRGRELLSRAGGAGFQITQFALGDDEIDYSLYNEDHPDGSQFYGEAIENLPIIEAFPDENNIMKHKLITLARGTTKIAILNVAGDNKPIINKGASYVLSPTTNNFNSLNNIAETTYVFSIADRRLFTSIIGNGGPSPTAVSNVAALGAGSRTGITVRGQQLNLQAINSNTLFGNKNTLSTTITIQGLDSGARLTIPITITKDASTSGFTATDSAVNYPG